MKAFKEIGEDYDNEGFYYVEKILEKKIEKDQVKYKVKWKDWPLACATWEPLENLKDVKDKIDEFEGIKKEIIKDSKAIKEGNIKVDIPNKLLDGKFIDKQLHILVEWKKRNNGEVPLNSYCIFNDIRSKVPDLMLDFLESKVITSTGLLNRKKKR